MSKRNYNNEVLSARDMPYFPAGDKDGGEGGVGRLDPFIGSISSTLQDICANDLINDEYQEAQLASCVKMLMNNGMSQEEAVANVQNYVQKYDRKEHKLSPGQKLVHELKAANEKRLQESLKKGHANASTPRATPNGF
jgi:uncharacterized protein YoaH (UPF0181 family)